MTCDFAGEMLLPLPFSILAGLVSLGLLIARFMKNGTKYFVSVLALIDILLKVNWIFLLGFLVEGSYLISVGILTYCLVATFLVNMFIWRRLYFKYKLD